MKPDFTKYPKSGYPFGTMRVNGEIREGLTYMDIQNLLESGAKVEKSLGCAGTLKGWAEVKKYTPQQMKAMGCAAAML